MLVRLLVLGALVLALSACRSDSVPRPVYALTVVQGTGTGSYAAGTVVTIEATPPAPGRAFLGWAGDSLLLNEPWALRTELLMPEREVRVSARFLDTTAYLLTVEGGMGSGLYRGGTQVRMVADPAPARYVFAGWAGDTLYLDHPDRDTATLTMPYQAVSLRAGYALRPLYPLTVQDGTGSGAYQAGDTAWVVAATAAAGMRFAQWRGDTPYLADSLADSTYLLMPSFAVGIHAQYQPLASYTLTVLNGSGSGTYFEGVPIPVAADPAPNDTRFIRWRGEVPILDDMWSASTLARLAGQDAEVQALYRNDTLPALSYRLDIAPVFALYCSACHYDGSNYSPLDSYATTQPYLADIRQRVATRNMPVGGGMPAYEIALILAWIDQGAPNN